jgi:hypothetical protein
VRNSKKTVYATELLSTWMTLYLCQIRDEIRGLDINHLTPVEALDKLSDIKKIVTGQ